MGYPLVTGHANTKGIVGACSLLASPFLPGLEVREFALPHHMPRCTALPQAQSNMANESWIEAAKAVIQNKLIFFVSCMSEYLLQ